MLTVTVLRRRAGWIGLLLATSVVLALVPAGHAQAWKSPERELQYRHNHARTSRDIRYLRISASLSLKAERHSQRMANSGYIYHSPCLSCHFSSYSWSVGGENVGVGASMKSLHLAFMDSAPHRRNILYRAYKYVGIGVVRSGGRMWVTVLFMG
ncbi:MAG TPA: CAP domain-containing protein [Actinomycetota bacterium]|jgi:uncharacterized protein YkwD|nr:CAP domain-containing protein [Actinomycetota bacterium]